MNILFTICGRAGSKGLASKNVKNFCGYPLALYTLSVIDLFAKQQPNHKVFVALNTDSEQLKEIFRPYTSVLIVDRKPEQATDTAGKLSVIKDTYFQVKKSLDSEFDCVIDLDITSPLRTVDDIIRLIQKKEASPELDVIFSVVKSRRNPYFNMVELVDDQAKLVKPSQYTARQQTPPVYDMNASMYLYAPGFLKTKERIFDGKCGVLEMQDYHVLDIDSEDDFIWITYIYAKLIDQDMRLNEIKTNINYISLLRECL